jgi:hypothetical protein
MWFFSEAAVMTGAAMCMIIAIVGPRVAQWRMAAAGGWAEEGESGKSRNFFDKTYQLNI